MLMGFFLSACSGSTPQPAPPQPTASPPPPDLVLQIAPENQEDALLDLLVAEREASIQGNLPLLAALWSEDARIVDGRGSVETSDDYVWQGRDAILDRYQLAVFPAPPPPLPRSQLDTSTTLAIFAEDDGVTLINGEDRWRFIIREGRWWLQELVYSAPTESSQ